MVTHLRVVLAALLVPLVIFSTPGTARAANTNPWHRTTVVDDGGLFGQSVNCSVVWRYGQNRTSIVGGTGECEGGVEQSPGGSQLSEAGSEVTVTWKGSREGDPADPMAQWTGEPTCGYATGYHQGIKCVPSQYGGRAQIALDYRRSPVASWPSGDGKIRVRFIESTRLGGWRDEPCRDLETHDSLGQFCNPNTQSWGNRPGDPSTYNMRVSHNLAHETYFTQLWAVRYDTDTREYDWSTLMPYLRVITAPIGGVMFPPAGPGVGNGEGDPCEASLGTTLTSHPNDGLGSVRGTLDFKNTAAQLDKAGGACVVNEVCVQWKAGQGPWPDATRDSCVEVNYPGPTGEPGGDSGGDQDGAPPPPKDDKGPKTEQGFWQDLLDGMKGLVEQIGKLLKSLIDGFGMVVDAIGAVVSAILDGLKGLFIPDGDVIADAVSGARDAWADTAPGVYIGALAGLPSKVVVPTSDCRGPAVAVKWGNIGGSAGERQELHPFTSCGPGRAEFARVVRIGLTVLLFLGALMVGARILAASIGVDARLGGGDGQ